MSFLLIFEKISKNFMFENTRYILDKKLSLTTTTEPFADTKLWSEVSDSPYENIARGSVNRNSQQFISKEFDPFLQTRPMPKARREARRERGRVAKKTFFDRFNSDYTFTTKESVLFVGDRHEQKHTVIRLFMLASTQVLLYPTMFSPLKNTVLGADVELEHAFAKKVF
ncbi:uncharacterized protein LOC112552217 [Pogonomyrmex barbatus]|uniref:Uncharacterized protein LOC112552217 n=1 Tax=Pogonomyrmex barbatus TaxID=144034 RepID=A0A8N1S205_9HYME|nr:uncharacterized protein LOC112552217 [Pogonomyrmex barbatus]